LASLYSKPDFEVKYCHLLNSSNTRNTGGTLMFILAYVTVTARKRERERREREREREREIIICQVLSMITLSIPHCTVP
jgi:hypothetical protein